ncbi:HepT-like ribonuclease domain-containing protein [Orrella marina]|nr:HepT-like ribonuclease domain-containing protein [Orrella marina]
MAKASNNIQRVDPVDPAFAAQHYHIPWRVLYTMCNRLSHGYDKVDMEIV